MQRQRIAGRSCSRRTGAYSEESGGRKNGEAWGKLEQRGSGVAVRKRSERDERDDARELAQSFCEYKGAWTQTIDSCQWSFCTVGNPNFIFPFLKLHYYPSFFVIFLFLHLL